MHPKTNRSAKRTLASTFRSLPDAVPSATAASASAVGHFAESPVAAIIHNQHREVGVVVYSPCDASIHIAQFCDTATFGSTRAFLVRYGASTVCVPIAARESFVSLCIRDGHFVKSVPRSWFNNTDGVAALMDHVAWIRQDSGLFAVERGGVARSANVARDPGDVRPVCRREVMRCGYLALAAANALFRQTFVPLRSASVVPGSAAGLVLACCSLPQTLFLDVGAIRALHLVPSPGNGPAGTQSLFRSLNRTVTRAGARLLRASILAPLKDHLAIALRQECVGALVAHQPLLRDVRIALSRHERGYLRGDSTPSLALTRKAQLDVCCSMMQGGIPLDPSVRWLASAVYCLLRVRRALRSVHPLRSALTHLKDTVLAANSLSADLTSSLKGMFEGLESAMVNPLLRLADVAICTALHEEVDCSGATAVTTHIPASYDALAIVLSLKTSSHDSLESSRALYLQLCENLSEYCNSMYTQYSSKLKLRWSTSAGLHFILLPSKAPSTDSEINLPGDVFTRFGQEDRIVYRTAQLDQLNQQLADSFHDVMRLAADFVITAFDCCRNHLRAILLLTEAVSYIDLLQSFAVFAGFIQEQGHCVQPRFSDTTLHLSEAKPILEKFGGGVEAVPFTIRLTISGHRCVILSGANNTGKSSLMASVAHHCICAAIGAHVPASSATFPLLDAILTRMTFGDSLECNASSFAMEMGDMASLLQRSANEKSLLLIDELGRGTQPLQGASLSWALVEACLLRYISSFAIAASHFSLLSGLAAYYPAWACNMHLTADGNSDKAGLLEVDNVEVVLTRKAYHLLPGPVSLRAYGLQAARCAQLPQTMLDFSSRALDVITASHNHRWADHQSVATRCARQAATLRSVCRALSVLCHNHESLSDDIVLASFVRIQSSLSELGFTSDVFDPLLSSAQADEQ